MTPRTKTYRARILVATLAAVALAAPVAYAGENGGHSSGGPAYGVPVTQAPGDAIHTELAGRAGESGGDNSGGPAYGVPVTQAPGDAIHTEIAARTGELGPGRPLPLESLQLVRALRVISPASQTDGFDWSDAGVGAGIGIAALLLAAAAARLRGSKLAHS